MSDKPTISGEIDIQISHLIQQIPSPTLCTITKIYSDDHVDVETSIGIMKYVPLIGYTKTGATGILIFIDNDLNNPYCISLDLSNII